MQTKLTALCVLVTIIVGVYCARLSQTIRQLSEGISRVQQEQFLRDSLFNISTETFLVPPSKSVRVRLVFAVAETGGAIDLLTDNVPSDQTREYILIKQVDPITKLGRCGFIVHEGNCGTIREFRPVVHPKLTAEELDLLLFQKGRSIYRGFGSHGGVTREVATNRVIKCRFEVSE
jgi:hypothetical protein